jgi:hypothetical protein
MKPWICWVAMLASAKSARQRHLRLSIENQTSTKRTQTRLIRRGLVVLDELPWLFRCACRRWVVQRHSQVNLDRRPSDSHLLDQQTYQLLNDCTTLDEFTARIYAFGQRCSALDKPFAWRFTRQDLGRRLNDPHLLLEPAHALPTAA